MIPGNNDVCDMAELAAILETQAAEGRRLVEAEQVSVEAVEVMHAADMQFQGQSHMLSIPVASPAVDRETLQRDFEAAYWRRFEVTLPEIRAVVVNLHTTVLGRRPALDLRALLPERGDTAHEPFGRRRVWFAGGWQEAALWRREALAPGATLAGPVIVEQLDTTTVVPPGALARVDEAGNLLVRVEGDT